MITISLCMIVKNEEKVLARCLDSVANLVDEIIIVDTGSTDQTKKIAARYTDKIYDFTWVNDFSAARNYSFSLATKDYVYVADADEIIDEANRNLFIQLKQTLLPEIDIVQMHYVNQLSFNTTYNFDDELRPKLYKRLRNFTWTEPVHEMVRLDPIIYDSDIRILHMPESHHANRDFHTFLSFVERGGRLSKRLHHMYAMELFISGNDQDFIEAAPVFEQTMCDEKRSLDEVKEAACILTRVARIQADQMSILKYVLKDLMSEPSSESCYELGECFFAQKDYAEAIVWYYNAAYETESILSLAHHTILPLKRLIQCYQLIGDDESVKLYKERLHELEAGNENIN